MQHVPRPHPVFAICLLGISVPLVVGLPLYDQVVLPRLAATWVLTGLATTLIAVAPRRNAKPFRRGPLTATVAVLLLSACSTASGVDPRGSLLGEFQRYQGLLPLAVYALLMVATACALTTRDQVRLVAWSVVAGGTGAAVYALLDVAGWDWIEWTTGSPSRAGGLFAQPNVLGIQLVASALVGIGLVMSERGWRQQVAGAATGAMFAVLILTMSRGSWVAAVVSIPVVLAITRTLGGKQTLAAFVIAVASIALVAVGPHGRAVLDSAAARAEAGLDPDNQSTRLGLWRLAAEMWSDRPILGAGPDGFSSLFPEYRAPDQPGIGTGNFRPESAHNFFLDQLVGVGAAGTAVLVGLVALTLLPTLLRARHESVDALEAALAAGVIAYFVAVFFSFSEAMTGWIPWMLMGGLMGVQGATARTSDESRGKPRSQSLLIGASVTAALGLAVTCGGLLIWTADWRSGQATRAGTLDVAIDRATAASRLNPLLPGYLLRLGEYEEAAGNYADAAVRFHEANERFTPTAYSLIAEARAVSGLTASQAGERIEHLLSRAEHLDPFNDSATTAIDEIRQALTQTDPAQTGPNNGHQ